MSLKKTDLALRLGQKIDGNMKRKGVPQRFGQQSSAVPHRERPIKDQAPALVAISCKLPSPLAAQLRAQHRLKLPDALQLATALEAGASAFVTHDRDFSGVTALPVLTGS